MIDVQKFADQLHHELCIDDFPVGKCLRYGVGTAHQEYYTSKAGDLTRRLRVFMDEDAIPAVVFAVLEETIF